MATKTKRDGLYGPEAMAGWEERARRAGEIRRSCVDCGGPTSEPVKVGRNTRPGRCQDPACRGMGHSIGQVAKALGVAHSTAGLYLSDPTRERERQRREKYRGTCADCNGPTDGPNTGRCKWCHMGTPSPHLLATSPTGFRTFTRRDCGTPGCVAEKAPGRHVCDTHAERLDRIRALLEAEAGHLPEALAA